MILGGCHQRFPLGTLMQRGTTPISKELFLRQISLSKSEWTLAVFYQARSLPSQLHWTAVFAVLGWLIQGPHLADGRVGLGFLELLLLKSPR